MSRKLMPMRGLIRCAVLALVAAAVSSCGDVVRTSRAPVMLQVAALVAGTGTSGGSVLLSDVIRNVTTPAPCTPASPCPTVFNDTASASMVAVMKDVTLSPTPNNDVTITSYHVAFRRTDGHNQPGVDVPYPFDGAVTATVAAGTSPTAVGFELVRHTSKEESPLVELVTNPAIISTIADVTFYGTDRVGNAVSATGSIQIDFGNFGDTQ
jgi:hypothetical protein